MVDCLIFYGPSGVGKSTLISMLMKMYYKTYSFSVSHTTRLIRPNETDGVDYNFINVDSFLEGVYKNEFIEWTKFSSNYYGTSKESIHKATEGGKICILDLDLNGVKSMKASEFNCKYIFIKPKSLDDLLFRLQKRGTDHNIIKERIDKAKDDLLNIDEGMFDLVLVNDDLNKTFDKLITFVDSI